MKVSVSLAAVDVEFLDAYAAAHGVPSRSAAVAVAVDLLRHQHLADDYAAAWSDPAEFEGETWDAPVADGIDSR